MSAPTSVLDAQVRMLTAVVDEHRDARCQDLLDAARRAGGESVGRAHRECRERMRLAVAQERARMDAARSDAEARLASRVRASRQRADRRSLEQAWPLLHDALLARWRDAGARRRWIAMVVDEALAFLPREPWRIEHPAGWDVAELAPHAEFITRHGGAAPAPGACDDVTAGLRVVAGGARLDGTRRALLRDRSAVDAALLGEMRRQPPGAPAP